MLTRLKGVWLGELEGRRVVIIDVDQADKDVLEIVDDFLRERKERRDGQRQGDVLLRSTVEQDVEM